MSTLAQQSFRPVQPPKVLTEDTPVSIVFRGGPAIVDKWDGQDIILPLEADQARLAGVAGWQSRYYEPCEIARVPWGVAQHIRARAIVPGTRDPYQSRKATFQIAIASTPTRQHEDARELCTPLSDAELEKFGQHGEGIDRSIFLDSRREGTTMATMAAISHVGNVNDVLNAEPDAEDLAPAAEHEGLKEIRGAEIAYQGAGGADASQTRRGRPSRFKDDR